MREFAREEPEGITPREIDAKYRKRQTKHFMPGGTDTGKELRDRIEKTQRNSGRWLYRDGEWVRSGIQARKHGHREYADWGRHLDDHDLLLKQLAAGEWGR